MRLQRDGLLKRERCHEQNHGLPLGHLNHESVIAPPCRRLALFCAFLPGRVSPRFQHYFNRKAVLMAANVEEETILGLPSRGKILSASNFSKEPMPRTLRTVLLGGGGVPPGSAVSGL